MDQRQIDNALNRHMVRVRALALAFSSSAAFFVVIAWVVIEMVGLTPLLEIPFAIASAVAVLQLLVILAGYLISRAIRRPPPRSGAAGDREIEEAMQRYTKSVVVSAALREFACVVGLLLTLFTGDMTWVVFLCAAALISSAVHWPRREAVRDFLQQQFRGL